MRTIYHVVCQNIRDSFRAILLLTFALSVSHQALAQSTFNNSLDNPIASPHLYCFLHGILGAFILIVFPIIVLMLVYSGFLFISAQGNPSKIDEAKKWFFWVVIGGLIVLGAQALTWAIEGTVNDILQKSGVGTPINTGRDVCGD
jgi:formate hydrogenlyase subunit 3/multisubunit Na+/H+ antiporter MnhD subunit